MKNINMTVNGNILTVTIDLSKNHGRSKTGKTTIVATTAGNVEVPDTGGVKLGINAYKA